MNKITGWFGLGLVVILAVAAGCSKPHPSDSAALQGSWTGRESNARASGSPTLVLSGSNLEFHGANTNEWYKATFTLHEDTNPKQLIAVITECPFPMYVGKTVNAIYQRDGGTFTLAAFEPGTPGTPPNFNAHGARKFVFTADKP